jgi:agmatine deiminase
MFSFPPEWSPHEACWLAWPAAKDLWGEDLVKAQKEFTEFCKNIEGEKLKILVTNSKAKSDAKKALEGFDASFYEIPYGDIWLRDTAPLFLKSEGGKLATTVFRFNGWGEKFVLPYDDEIARKITGTFAGKIEVFSHPWVLEGGSIEVDEFGTCLTTEQCLLNPNRNPHLSKSEIESLLKDSLGLKKILWLKEGLLNDHTDGHIDTIARFLPNQKVLCMKATSPDDPNAKVLAQISHELRALTNAEGNHLEVIEIPSPGKILDEDEKIMPASYVNFYISNETVVIPIYGSSNDEAAVRAIAACFPNRKTRGVFAKTILKGGGAFHCISQQLPKGSNL